MATTVTTTVLTPATSYDLVALADLKADIGIAGNAEDAFLRRAISKASAAIAQFCNHPFAVETIQDVIDIERDSFPYQVPGGVRALQASRWPVISVASVTEDQTALVDGKDYRCEAAKGHFLRLSITNASVVNWPALPITLVYTAGYAAVPIDVQDACTRMVKAARYAKDRDPFLKADDVAGIGRQEYWIASGAESGNMPPDVADILENYRVPQVA